MFVSANSIERLNHPITMNIIRLIFTPSLFGWLWAKHRISSGPSANRNSHACPSGQGAAMPIYA